ncbi:MAG: hypothetical protein C0410_05570 [Anaerolinea sp.]|nr:hypothetical protein [Anaerolinea sp.]
MSSIVAVQGSQGFVISTDSIVIKYASDTSGKIIGKVTGITRKQFLVHDDILVVGLGNWNSYFPVFNKIASKKLSKNNALNEIHRNAKELTDSRVYVFSKTKDDVILDIIENGQIRHNASGAVIFPETLINSLFLTMYESESSLSIRKSGMLGIASLVNAFNLFAASLCNDIAAPFDTVIFTKDGIFNVCGSVVRLPVSEFI